jgi:hypothetical protein
MPNYSKLLSKLKEIAGDYKNTVKVSNNLEETSDIAGKLFNKKGIQSGDFDIAQHTPDMMEEIVTNPKFSADNPYYLSEIQAKQAAEGKVSDGAGKRLLDEAIHQAQQAGADSIYLQADPTIKLRYGQKPLTMEQLVDFYKKNKFEIPNESTNFGATPMIRDLEKYPAMDMSTEARLKRAIDQGYEPKKGNILVNKDTGLERSINASFDPALVAKKGLLWGAAGNLYNVYDAAKSKFSDKIADATNLVPKQYRDPEQESLYKNLTNSLVDPINIVSGGADSVLATAPQVYDEFKKLKDKLGNK